MERLTRNSALCLVCNEEIVSTHRHDFKKCSCGNVGVDGGLAYQRRLFGNGPWRDTSTWEECSREDDRSRYREQREQREGVA